MVPKLGFLRAYKDLNPYVREVDLEFDGALAALCVPLLSASASCSPSPVYLVSPAGFVSPTCSVLNSSNKDHLLEGLHAKLSGTLHDHLVELLMPPLLAQLASQLTKALVTPVADAVIGLVVERVSKQTVHAALDSL